MLVVDGKVLAQGGDWDLTEKGKVEILNPAFRNGRMIQLFEWKSGASCVRIKEEDLV